MEYRSTEVHVKVEAPISEAAKEILTPDALQFVGVLCAKFDDRRRALLAARETKAVEYDAGVLPTFLSPNSPAVSDPNWRCASIPADVQDRRVEITGEWRGSWMVVLFPYCIHSPYPIQDRLTVRW